MAEEVDASVIKKTQEILGSVIKRPALTEKSLKKPPFRFLHDIITNIIKTHGFMKGLYTPEELQSENVKDKENKIVFLQKSIDALQLIINQPVNLKPSKVVAGHEPQKTNVFLQSLGTAVKNKLDSKDAVAKVLNGNSSPVKAIKERRQSVDKRSKNASDKAHARSLTKTLDPVKKVPVTSTQSKESVKSKDGERSKEKQKESKSKDREKSRDRARHSKSEDSKKSEKSSKEKSKEKEKSADAPESSQLHISSEDLSNELSNNVENEMNDEPNANVMNGDINMEMPQDSNNPNENGLHHEDVIDKPLQEKSHKPQSSRLTRPPSARSRRTKPTDENEPNDVAKEQFPNLTNGHMETSNFLVARPPSARPPSARPSSSRPAPPRIRIRHVVENEEPSIRPKTAKPVENVILDQGHQSEEEDESFVVMEEDSTTKLDEPKITSSLPAETPDEDKGSLVKKLLETKKDLEGGSQQSPTRKVEIDKSQMSDNSRNRDLVHREMEQLRSFVQLLSRTAVPLGKMLDFLQEDIDGMKMELRMWRSEHDQNLLALRKEQGATESSLEPLRVQLDDLDQVVQNQLDANSALKASIARNDERMQRMLSSVNHKS